MENNTQKSNRLGQVVLGLSVAIATSLGFVGSALAAPPDPGGTGAALGDVETGITSWVSTYGVPTIVAIMLVGIGLALLIKLGRKGKSLI